jgi:hypothetical protein
MRRYLEKRGLLGESDADHKEEEAEVPEFGGTFGNVRDAYWNGGDGDLR